MNEKKKEEKKQELQRSPPQPLSPWERFAPGFDAGFFKEMDRFFEEYLPQRWLHRFGGGWPGHAAPEMTPFAGKTPSVDLVDREENFLVKAELPGVSKEDITISLADNLLTLEARVDKEEKEEKGRYCRREICHGSYRRTIALPAAVKENEAKATFKDGMLELVLPKVAKTRSTKIQVE